MQTCSNVKLQHISLNWSICEGAHHNSRGVDIAMVTQRTHRDSRKHSGSHLNGWGESSSRQHTDTQVSMHCNHGHDPASLCPPMKGRLWGLFLEGLKACSPALGRWRKWLPTSRHCWQHHTHFSLSSTLSRFIPLSVWDVTISPPSFMQSHVDLRLHSHSQYWMPLWASKLFESRVTAHFDLIHH